MIIQKILGFLLTALLFISCNENQSDNALEIKLEKLIASSGAEVGISVMHSGSNKVVSIKGDTLFPMLSTVKIPVALAVLNKVEKEGLSKDQELFISSEELLEHTWSPFREEFPNGNVAISLEEALAWMVMQSDNNITDVLIRWVGGEEYIEEFIANKNFIIRNNEEDMHRDWESQFKNKASPNAFSNLVKTFSEGRILNKENTEWLYQSMVKSTTGLKRIKGKLPDVEIAQRAGTSFTSEEGITGAINNIGIIQLPDHQKIYLSVFIHNIQGFEKGEDLIADIAKIVYEHYSSTEN